METLTVAGALWRTVDTILYDDTVYMGVLETAKDSQLIVYTARSSRRPSL